MSETGPQSQPPEETAEVGNASRAARFFFLRTTFGLLLTALLVVGGYMAYGSLVKESLPSLDIPQATVSTIWPGADPQTVEQEVTTEIETEVKNLQGVKTVTSASFDSSSIVAVEFTADADPRDSIARLRSAVSDAEAGLPADADKPTINEVSVDDRPIFSVVLYGAIGSAGISDLAEDLQDRLERLQGVDEVTVSGARDEVVQILLDPDRVLALGISPVTVRDAVNAANVDVPWGEIENDRFGATVRLAGRFRTVEDLKSLPVKKIDGPGGRTVRLDEIASVTRDLATEESRALFSWKGSEFRPSVEISVKKSPGADTVALIDRLRAELDSASSARSWPSSVNYRVSLDESEQIWDSLVGVFNNAWQAMLAVFVVLFLLLSWREGIIAGLAIPLTFSGVLMVIWLLGYTLNEMVIIGMVLALGLLVDVFILMMEGLHESIFVQKRTFGQAALDTVRRYALPAAAGQMTTILALAPLMAIGGVSGKFIRVLPVTAIICLVLSFIVAFLVAIPLARYLLGPVARKGDTDERRNRADRYTEIAAGRLQRWSLGTTLRSKKTAGLWTAGAVGLFVVSLIAVSQVSVVAYPKSDGRKMGISVTLPPATTLDTSQQVADRLGEIVRKKSYLESVVQLVGQKSGLSQGGLSSSLQPSVAENFIGFSTVFVPREDRAEPAYVYADRLRAELGALLEKTYAGASLVVLAETGRPTTGDAIEIDVAGQDLARLRELSEQVQQSVRQTEGTVDVRDNLGALKPEIALYPDRGAIEFYNLTPQQLATQVRYGMSTAEIGKFAVSGTQDDLDIMLGLNWPSRNGGGGGPTHTEELSLLRAFTPDGKTVALSALLLPRLGNAPVSIIHKDARRAITVLAKNEDRAVTDIVAELRPKLDRMQANWPAGYTYAVAGEAQETAETFGSAGTALVIAIIMIFATLVLMFGSFLQAIILLATLPLALIGTFLGFFIFGMDMSFFAFIGVITLMGIVANDAIVMIDTMNQRLQEGVGVAESAARGAAERLRPIISTSVTTIVGLIPLAIGNPMWRPLCFAVIFGLIAATLLSLIVVPCMYLLLTREGSRAQSSLD